MKSLSDYMEESHPDVDDLDKRYKIINNWRSQRTNNEEALLAILEQLDMVDIIVPLTRGSLEHILDEIESMKESCRWADSYR